MRGLFLGFLLCFSTASALAGQHILESSLSKKDSEPSFDYAKYASMLKSCETAEDEPQFALCIEAHFRGNLDPNGFSETVRMLANFSDTDFWGHWRQREVPLLWVYKAAVAQFEKYIPTHRFYDSETGLASFAFRISLVLDICVRPDDPGERVRCLDAGMGAIAAPAVIVRTQSRAMDAQYEYLKQFQLGHSNRCGLEQDWETALCLENEITEVYNEVAHDIGWAFTNPKKSRMETSAGIVTFGTVISNENSVIVVNPKLEIDGAFYPIGWSILEEESIRRKRILATCLLLGYRPKFKENGDIFYSISPIAKEPFVVLNSDGDPETIVSEPKGTDSIVSQIECVY